MKRYTSWTFSLLFLLLALSAADSRAQENSSEEPESGAPPALNGVGEAIPVPDKVPYVVSTPRNSDASFPLLVGLEKQVGFWKRIFIEFSVSQLVFFDPLDMSKIYEVLDVGEESRGNDYINGERARIAATHGVDLERVKAQRGIKERTAAGLKRAGRYLPQMQQIFKDRGLPVELTYIPLLESSYEINARSHAGALGMWQFMRRTGKQFMRVNASVDERRDPLESTRAAASFLKQAYESLGNWPLAITAYNFGPAGMARAVAEVGSDDLVELIQKYNHPYWGYPPKNFYAEFLVAVDIGKNFKQYFPGLELDSPVTIREIELKSNTSLASVINSSGLHQDAFLGWNPALSKGVRMVPAGYRVKLPTDKTMERVVEVAERRTQEQPQVVRHRVKRGETVLQIARRYGASVERILQVNGLRKAHLLQVGMTLVIPKV
jgi:membrane-bound lytic murein transglycosylase D